MEKLPRYVEYVRVSTMGQARRGTPESQILALTNLRTIRPGVAVLEEPVIEPGVSAMEVALSQRKKWLRHIEPLIHAGEIDEVRVAEFSRIIREDDLEDTARLLKLRKVHPFKIVDATGAEYRMDSLGDRLGLAFKSLQGGEEWADIQRRSLNGRERTLRAGKPGSGPAPAGLRHRKDEGWSIVEKWAPVIRRIYALCVEGVALAGIAERLNEDGIAPPRGKGWNFTYVRKILRNPAYKGELHQKLKGQEYTLPVPAIVDEATWDAAQAALSARFHVPLRARYALHALCRSLAHCGQCGRRMYVQGGGAGGRSAYTRYACPVCKGIPYHRADGVDRAVWNAVSAALLNADALLHTAATVADPETGVAEGMLAEADAELARLTRKFDHVSLLWQRDELTDAQYETQRHQLRELRQGAERRAEDARKAIAAAERARVQRSTLAATIELLRGRIQGADEKTRRAIVEAVVPLGTGQIRLHPDYRIEIRGVLPIAVEGTGEAPLEEDEAEPTHAKGRAPSVAKDSSDFGNPEMETSAGVAPA